MARAVRVRQRSLGFFSLISGKRVTKPTVTQSSPRGRRLRVEPLEARRLLSLGDPLPVTTPPIDNVSGDGNLTAPQATSVSPQSTAPAAALDLTGSRSPSVDVYTATSTGSCFLIPVANGQYANRWDNIPSLTKSFVADGSPVQLNAHLQLTNFDPSSSSWVFRLAVDGSGVGNGVLLTLDGSYQTADLDAILTDLTPGTHVVTVQALAWPVGDPPRFGGNLRVDGVSLNILEFNAIPNVGPVVDVYTAASSGSWFLIPVANGQYANRWDDIPSLTKSFVADGSPVQLNAHLQLTNFDPSFSSWVFRLAVDGSGVGNGVLLTLDGSYQTADLDAILTDLTPGTHVVTVQALAWPVGDPPRFGGNLRVDGVSLDILEFNPFPPPGVDEEVYVPEQKGDSRLTLRRNGDEIELALAGKKPQVLWRGDVGEVGKLTVYGARKHGNGLTIDMGVDDFSGVLPRGLVFDSVNQRKTDWLTIRGTAGADTFTIGTGSVAANSLGIQLRGVEQVTLDGGPGDDQYRISGLTTKIVLVDGSGTDTLDFSQATVGVNIDLSKSAGQARRVLVGNFSTLALKGTLDNVIGTPQADRIRGNSAANRIEGLGGDDWLYGQAGNDFLYGGPGNNVLLGGAGDDLLDANAGVAAGLEGRNLLIGGSGLDTLQGGPGEEILIGGATSYDGKPAALAAVMRQWASTESFQARRDKLDAGFRDVAAGWIQLKRKDKATPRGTVLDDGVRDSLFGGAGDDWLFNSSGDDVSDP